METVNAYLFRALGRFRDRPMQIARDRSWTYGEAAEAIHGVAEALRAAGVKPGDRVALVAENSPRWLHAFLGILGAGGVAVPRGEDISDDELEYVLDHSGSRVVLAGSPRAVARVPAVGRYVLGLESDEFPGPAPVDAAALEEYARARGESDLAVLLYTSGTTGQPKGVMLEQRNIAHNIRVLPPLVDMRAGDVWVSVLPSWHTFEQTVELCGFSVGCATVYSDKRRLRDDLRRYKPQFFASVPRIWETIHHGALTAIKKKGRLAHALFRGAYAGTRAWRRGNPLGLPLHLLGKALFYGKIGAATGGCLKHAVSGGGYLPPHVDEFFNHIGVSLLIGYGLTETAPVVAIRRPDANVLGTIGRAVDETEVRIGAQGTIQVKGPQIMRGYYKDEALTRSVLDEKGWFDTGDLGRLTDGGDLVFVGRAKETIVLSGGENIEPEPIENRLVESPLIHQVMLVGQDRKTLGALIVPDADAHPTEEQLHEVLKRRTGVAGGFRSFEAVNRFCCVADSFTTENGLLTQTLKKRRNVIAERFADEIDSLYA